MYQVPWCTVVTVSSVGQAEMVARIRRSAAMHIFQQLSARTRQRGDYSNLVYCCRALGYGFQTAEHDISLVAVIFSAVSTTTSYTTVQYLWYGHCYSSQDGFAEMLYVHTDRSIRSHVDAFFYFTGKTSCTASDVLPSVEIARTIDAQHIVQTHYSNIDPMYTFRSCAKQYLVTQRGHI